MHALLSLLQIAINAVMKEQFAQNAMKENILIIKKKLARMLVNIVIILNFYNS